MPGHPDPQSRGAITLMVTVLLALVATLASHYSSRSVFMDQLASRNQMQSTQAQLAAEAALAWAQAELQSQHSAPDTPPTLWANASREACPDGVDALRWQCVRLSPPPQPPQPGLPASTQEVTAMRDLITSPHVIELRASARLPAQGSSAQVQQSLFVPALAPAPEPAPAAAIVLNGCLSAAASAAICPRTGNTACTGSASTPAVQSLWMPDSNADGLISPAERSACLALTSAQLPGGGDLTGPALALPRNPCSRAAWRSVLGEISPAQIQAWSAAQARNGLHSQSQPPRSIYWVDSPDDWTLSAGQPESPVLLVFSATACAVRCPRIAPGTHIQGTVVLETGCQDDKSRGWSAGLIDGQLVVESGLPELAAGSLIRANANAHMAFQRDWPRDIDARRVQSIPGSWTRTP